MLGLGLLLYTFKSRDGEISSKKSEMSCESHWEENVSLADGNKWHSGSVQATFRDAITSFGGKTSGGVAKCRLFCPASEPRIFIDIVVVFAKRQQKGKDKKVWYTYRVVVQFCLLNLLLCWGSRYFGRRRIWRSGPLIEVPSDVSVCEH